MAADDAGRVDRRPDVMRAGEQDDDAHLVQEAHLGGLGLGFERLRVVGLRANGEAKLPADAESSLVREQVEHLPEFEDPQRMFVHRTSVERSRMRNQRTRLCYGALLCFPIGSP